LKHQTALPNRKLLIIRSYEYVGWGYMSDQTETSTEAIAMNLQKKPRIDDVIHRARVKEASTKPIGERSSLEASPPPCDRPLPANLRRQTLRARGS